MAQEPAAAVLNLLAQGGEGRLPGKAGSAGTAAGRGSSCNEVTASSARCSPRFPRSTGAPKRVLCHTGSGTSSQNKEKTKYALLHHDTRTLQILKNKREQDSGFPGALFQASVLAGGSWEELISCRSWCPSSGGSCGLVAVRDQGEDNSFRFFRDFDNRQQTASLACGNRDA